MIRTITKCLNPVWADAAHTAILCQVAIAEQVHPKEPPGFMYEFMCVANDVEEHGQRLWKDLIAGKYGTIAAYVAPPKPEPVVAKPGTAPKAI